MAKKRAKATARYRPAANDRLSGSLDAAGLIPPEFRGSDDFLDLVTWNIRYFHDEDKPRVERVSPG
jgi:hypothetical protein